MSRTLIPDDLGPDEQAGPAPEVAAPEVAAPEVAAPEVAVPEVAAPEAAVPEVAAPEVPAPELPAPATPPRVTEADLTVPGARAGSGSRGSAGGKMLLGCGVLAVGFTLLCCCGGGVLTTFGPDMMLSYFLEDAPLPGGTTAAMPLVAASAKERACAALAVGEQVVLSPSDASVMLMGGGLPEVAVLRIAAEGERATLDLSFAVTEESTRYVNVHTRGGFKIEKGWFTDLKLDEFILSGHDWSEYVRDQQMASSANQSMANQRVQNPEIGALLDSTEYLAVEGGAFAVRLQPDGAANRLLCGGGSLESLMQAQPDAPSLE